VFAEWTTLSGEEVCRRLNLDPDLGLTETEVERRRRRWGDNVLVESRRMALFVLILNQFKDFMVLILLGATLISALLGEYSDALTIVIIVLINAFLGLIQEYRAERSLTALKKLAAPRTKVMRGGAIAIIPARELVPGDFVYLEAGDRVSADLRLLVVQSLSINESALTGEAEAVLKRAYPLPAAAGTPGDAFNMAFSGTEVLAGRGYGVATATGMHTEIGRIAHLIEGAEQAVTPLSQRLERLGKILVAACVAICAGITALGVARGEEIYFMFMAGVSLAVAAIPEGLPAIVSVSLALGVQRMIRRRAIVRRLPAVETLGSASIICSDKTGTLTENRMSVSRLYCGGSLFKMEDKKFWIKEEQGWAKAGPGGFEKLHLPLTIAAYCNNAYPERGSFKGDPTEVALAEASLLAGFKVTGKEMRRKKEFPFSSERKMMSIVFSAAGKQTLQLKGAPELVLQRCRYEYAGGKIDSLDPARRRELLEQVERLASLGLRALAVAYRELPANEDLEEAERVEKDLVWSGLLGLEDPPRPEVLPAIRLCRQAGIRVIMITGDHRATAEALARRLEILRPGGEILTGEDLNRMDDRRFKQLIGRVDVFARVSPAHKLRIVHALKSTGEVVAMTGDGINDAPAIKEADIGIAMGQMGTDVTRETADLVLSDDNFSTIVAAVEEGRNIYSNIRKFIRFLLGCNTGEVLTMVLAILAGMPLPLQPIQILWINLVTDGLPALALGADAPEKSLMSQPPRRRGESIFSGRLWGKLLIRGALIALATVVVFGISLAGDGDLPKAQTLAFATLITAQLAYVFDCRSDGKVFGPDSRPPNWYLTAAVATSFILMLLVIYQPFLSGIFYTIPLPLYDWALVGAAGVLPSVLDGAGALSKRALPRFAHRKAKFR
jgi:Ca2+-transporting ATPase